jgi:hypothetical protein
MSHGIQIGRTPGEPAGGQNRANRVAALIAVAAFAGAAAVAGWAYLEHLREAKRLEFYYSQEDMLERGRGKMSPEDMPKGRRGRQPGGPGPGAAAK